MNPRDADPLTVLEPPMCTAPHTWYQVDPTGGYCSECGAPRKPWLPEPQYATIRDRPGITIPLVLAAVVVVAAVLALAVWGGTR